MKFSNVYAVIMKESSGREVIFSTEYGVFRKPNIRTPIRLLLQRDEQGDFNINLVPFLSHFISRLLLSKLTQEGGLLEKSICLLLTIFISTTTVEGSKTEDRKSKSRITLFPRRMADLLHYILF